jgi:DNA-binding NtrC family response regulator
MTAPAQLLVGMSPQIAKLRTWLDKVAASEASVLITGETGTGKECVARYLHEHSLRAQKPMACINCSALPEGLIESELFGHERGAFTGAFQSERGRIRDAAGGTLFLDEIGDMPNAAQAKILRALENREVTPVGGRRSEPINVRVIAATNVEPRALLADNRLRRDLFYRLNVVEVRLPPLRDRKEDIVCLFDHFMRARLSRGVTAPTLSAAGVRRMIEHDWPGNVREVRNLVERLLIDLPAGDIPVESLPGAPAEEPSGENERERLLEALVTTRWNKRKAAAALQWSRMTLYRKLAKYKIPARLPER